MQIALLVQDVRGMMKHMAREAKANHVLSRAISKVHTDSTTPSSSAPEPSAMRGTMTGSAQTGAPTHFGIAAKLSWAGCSSTCAPVANAAE